MSQQSTTATAPSTQPTPDTSSTGPALVKAAQLQAGTYNNTAVCVFDASTATTTRTGDSGNVFGLCTPCATAYDADAVTSAGCSIYPGLCTQTGEHTEHSNHTHGVDRTGWPVSVGFVQLETGEPLLYVDKGLAADFSPEDAPHTAAQLRAAADAIEGMAAKVETARALARLRKVRETADTAFAEVLTIMERAVVDDGADPVEVGERVLELLAEVRAEGCAPTPETDIDAHLETVAAEYRDCPRCRNKMDLPGASRATPDREIEICGPCCSDEAMREAAGLPWPAVAEWPVAREARA